MPEWSQDSSVSVVTGVGARRRGIVAPFPAGQDIFIFPQTSGKRLGTTESPDQCVPGTFYWRDRLARGVKPTTFVFLVSRLRIREAVPPLPNVPSCYAQ